MKKFLSLALIAAMLLSCAVLFGSCDKAGSDDEFKLGVICLHDEDSTYDLNFINGVKEAQKALGLRDDQVIIKRNIPESNACYEAALDLVDEGCDVIFANSFGHETHILAGSDEHAQHHQNGGHRQHLKQIAALVGGLGDQQQDGKKTGQWAPYGRSFHGKPHFISG